MAVTNNTTKYFEGNNPISFRSLSTAFGGAESDGSIRFSKYRRDEVSDTPIVPNAIENENISTSNNLSAEDFRGSIKQYEVAQTGSDENIQFQSYFNNNVSRNVIKKLRIQGTCFSTDVNEFAATLNLENQDILNLDIEVTDSGKIHGAGGNVNISSGNGGGALYVQSGSSTRNFNLNISSGGQVWAGGGSGSQGTAGNTVSNRCSQTRTSRELRSVTTTTRGTGNPINVEVQFFEATIEPKRWTSLSNANSRLRRDCRDIRSGAYAIVRGRGFAPGSSEECRSSGRGGAGSGCYRRINWSCAQTTFTGAYNRPARTVTNTERFTVTNTHRETVSASGGAAGNAGLGQGYSQTQTSGNPGGTGTSTPCRSGWSGTGATGNPGNAGTDGGDWGEDGIGTGAGRGGDALSYAPILPTIRGESSDTFKGKKTSR